MSSIFAAIPSSFIPFVILGVSLISLTIILERAYTLLNRIQLLKKDEEMKLLKLLQNNQLEDAASYCRMHSHPAYHVVLDIIENTEVEINLKSLAEESILREISKIEKYIPTLGTISTVAPLLGLLGTVTGMIKAFRAFGQSGDRSGQLFGGIDEALITTALGLIVAIPSLIMYNYYVKRVNILVEEMNLLSKMAIDIIEK